MIRKDKEKNQKREKLHSSRCGGGKGVFLHPEDFLNVYSPLFLSAATKRTENPAILPLYLNFTIVAVTKKKKLKEDEFLSVL